MVKELRVTGGFNGSLATDLTDVLAGLEGAAVKGALVAEGASWPASSSTAWQPCNVTGSDAGARVVSQQLDDTAPAGHFHWWLWVQAGASNYVVLVMDPDAPAQPWHIWVH